MRLLVFGATGGTGRALLDQGLAQGHQMTAFVRNSAALEPRAGLAIVQGDVTDAMAVGRAVAGHEAVLSALGPRSGQYGVLPGGVQNIVAAMSQAGVRRVIHVSSFGVGDSLAQMGWVARQVFVPLFLRKALDEKEIEEEIIRGSDRDWIIRACAAAARYAAGQVRPKIRMEGERARLPATARDRPERAGRGRD